MTIDSRRPPTFWVKGLFAMKITWAACFASLVGVAGIGLAPLSSAADGQTGRQVSRLDGKMEAVVDAQGNLHVPSSYRADYEFLGSWAIAADKGVGSSQIHNVYATPGTIAVAGAPGAAGV